jgi:hypothetical protein
MIRTRRSRGLDREQRRAVAVSLLRLRRNGMRGYARITAFPVIQAGLLPGCHEQTS